MLSSLWPNPRTQLRKLNVQLFSLLYLLALCFDDDMFGLNVCEYCQSIILSICCGYINILCVGSHHQTRSLCVASVRCLRHILSHSQPAGAAGKKRSDVHQRTSAHVWSWSSSLLQVHPKFRHSLLHQRQTGGYVSYNCRNGYVVFSG